MERIVSPPAFVERANLKVLREAPVEADAFVAAWLPGTEGQRGGRWLFGDCRPTGKLSHPWPCAMSQIPIKWVARSFQAQLDNILTYFTHRITNAALEGLNNRIAGLVKKAFGYRNRERFKTDILFHLGGLDLYPRQ